ncbi:MAG: universal stress protein [Paracoccaceae bacterium]|nr:universal stress protein [Paracoccaceae bacterium]MDE2912116.1 universal stress protein [Paracoccaceae bacterium]
MYDHIVVPVAPDHIGEYFTSLDVARRLLSKAGRLSVLSVLEELPSYVGSYFPSDQIKKNLVELKDAIETELGGEDVDVHVRSGHPTNTILAWAEKNNADCIVVSSHRPGLPDLLLGSTAARVVRHAQCAVVVLR